MRKTATATRRTMIVLPGVGGAAADAAAVAGAPDRQQRSRAPSTTARRATGCGSTPPSPTTPSTPSTGPGTGPSRGRSRRTGSSSAAPARSPTTARSDPAADATVRRAVEFWRETDLRTAGRVEEHPLGVALFDEQLPEMWILNQLHVVRPEPELEAGALGAELDRLSRQSKHPRVTGDGDPTGQRLDAGMQESGYRPDR